MPTKTKPEWKETGGGNRILRFDDFYVSYNPNPSLNPGMALFAMFGDNTREETALKSDTGPEFFVLNGDFRADYEACDTYEQALAVYQKHKAEHRSQWSMD